MDLSNDLIFAEVVAEQFDDYIHAEVLFYPVGSVRGRMMPMLTIGTWLETEWRLAALRAQDAARVDEALHRARSVISKVRSRAAELYTQKARREFKSRLDTWEMFLNDRSEDAARVHAFNRLSGYRTHAHTRFKLELLKDDVAQLSTQLARLRLCDARLRARFEPGHSSGNQS